MNINNKSFPHRSGRFGFTRLATTRFLGALAFSMALAQPTLAADAPRAAGRSTATVVVEGVQMPAWVERAGAKPEPLVPGFELKANDRVRTGHGSRLLLRSSDGSSIKLGENANLVLGTLQTKAGNVFAATMDVLQGAFRFTTDVFAKKRQRRDIAIRVATVTAGIRGTDLWGKSEPNRQIVCLIEGKIGVTPQNEAEITMDQAMQFYIRENNKSLPVSKVSAQQLREWATETEIQPGGGALRRGGQWKLTLATAETQQEALQTYDQLRQAGFAASIAPVSADGKNAYAVRIANLPSKAEAEALSSRLKGYYGQGEPKVSR